MPVSPSPGCQPRPVRRTEPLSHTRPREYRDWIDVIEVLSMWTSFAEPLTFSLRGPGCSKSRRADFDVVR